MKKTVLILGLGAAGMLIAAGPAAAADGKAVFEKTCKACHMAMKPKLGDKAAWAPLIKRGVADLTASAIKGKGPMPPRGGAGSDADVKAAVEYMVGQGK